MSEGELIEAVLIPAAFQWLKNSFGRKLLKSLLLLLQQSWIRCNKNPHQMQNGEETSSIFRVRVRV